MPRRDYKTCRRCGRHASEVGAISHERYCFDCGQVVYRENIMQLKSHSGPFAKHHRTACIKAWGGYTREEVEALLGDTA